ncbi:MAG: putative ABC exporter domain-containing protein [Candidatus Hinthialibacter antarcticus]|nr:putative ABC exporter domain-containing protein [Candidatus Hinthialibacter antarcticus]
MPSNFIPLLYLLRLRTKAWFRHTLYSFFSFKRAIFAVVALCMITLWMIPMLFMGEMRGLPQVEQVRLMMPPFFLMFFVMNLVTAQKDMALNFEPCEIGFLFAGPFSRRDLLFYKLCDFMMKLTFSALIFSVVAKQWVAYWFVSFVGFFLLMVFMTLLDIVVVLMMQNVVMDRRVKWTLFGIISAVIVAFLLFEYSTIETLIVSGDLKQPSDYIKAFHATWLGTIVLAPFQVFAYLITSRSFFFEWIYYASIALAINAGLVSLILFFDKNYIEVSLEVSQRMYTRRKKALQGGVLGQSSSVKSAIRGVPRLPWWGGAGPVAWRQLTSAYRQWPSLLRLFLITAIFMGPFLIFSGFGSGGAIAGLAAVFGFAFIFFPQQIRFDFRSDIDQIEWLKQMPLNPYGVVAGQLLTPSLFLLCFVLVLGSITLITGEWMMWIGMLCFSVPGVVLMLEIENLFFLLFPVRMQPNSAGDIQFLGRIYLMMLLKMLVIVICGGLSFGIGFGAASVVQGLLPALSDLLFYIILASVAWVGCVLWMLVLFVCTVWAYQRFDLSADRPA